MATVQTTELARLFELDETAWLEGMADAIRSGRLDEVDYPNLADYLTDMARRDRREVVSRLSILIAHLLKWSHQSRRRSGSWRATIEVQRQELVESLESGTLRNHAVEVLARAYKLGVSQAVLETRLPESTFPTSCPYTIETLLSEPLAGDPA